MRARFSILVVLVMVVTMLPGASAGATPPDVLHLDESFTLTDDFQGSIIILGDDVTLDCAGHTVSGPGWAPDPSFPDDVYGGITVEFEVAGATVKNCTVTGFGGGISLHGTAATVIDNVAQNNGVGVGVFSNDNLIKNNVSNDNDYNGYLVQRAEGNLLKGNTAEGNVAHFSLELADNNTLVGNTVIGQGWDLAFEVAGSSGNTLRDNTASFIGEGFNLFPADGFESDGNILKGNVVTGVGESGIGFRLVQGSDNAFRGNNASGFFHGFRLADAIDNTLSDNTATHNSGNGFILASSTNNTLKNNRAQHNQYGFGVADSTGNTLLMNTARNNDRFGFSAFASSTANLLKENKACKNGEYNIWSSTTSSWDAVDNRVCGND